MGIRRCKVCGTDLGWKARSDAKTCSPRCRKALSRRSIPAELRERARWVRYRNIRRRDTWTKMPVQIDGTAASSTDPRTWSRYAQVRSYTRKGFVLNGDGIVCLDLDHCLVDGKPARKAAEILAALPATYVEVSPSGQGLHIFGFGSVPHGRRLPGGVEVYGTGRFITVTGQHYAGSGSTLGDLSGVIDRLLA